ncbi:MAG TPA: DUF4926 domain-containing protein [Verrucomicrobiae bacterium]|nr:DUF4926 domain-containing protein [Verrucomicrobiae bacterium]
MREYDIVELTCDLSERLPTGTQGTIVMVYPGQSTAFEVEFMDQGGKTIEVRSALRADQLKVVWKDATRPEF